jgi:hypothetical protein
MTKNPGSRRLTIFPLLSLLLLTLSVSSAWAATAQYLLILPGDSFVGDGTAPNRSATSSQVAGESFNLNIFAYDSGTNHPIDNGLGTNSQTTLTTNAGGGSSFTPSTFDLPESYGSPVVLHSRRGAANIITANLQPAATGDYTVSASASLNGTLADVTTVHVQRIDHFNFSVLPSFTAGVTNSITIRAEDASNTLCDAYNGTVQLTCYDAGINGAPTSTVNITFTNGVYTGNYTFYHATPYAHFQVVKSSTPAVTTTSANFTIAAAAFTQLLILGPGQSIEAGRQSGGNGRLSGSTQTSTRTAGVNFTLTAYACDAYWNTCTAAGQQVTLSSEDPSFSNQNQTFGGGASSVTFPTVNLHTVGDGLLTMTATAPGVTLNTDNVPLQATSLNNLGISIVAPATTTQNGNASVRGYDVYGNTVSVAGTTTLYLIQGGASGTTISAAASSWSLQGGSISGTGINITVGTGYSGTLNVRRAGNNYHVRVYNAGAAVQYSNSAPPFSVLVGPAARYLVVMPGQTHTPGERYYSIWGRNGQAPDGRPSVAQTAGVPFNALIVAADLYGNQVDRTEVLSPNWNGTTYLTQQDGSASVSPNPISVSSGSASPSFTLTLATQTQVLSVPTNGLALTDSGIFVVNSTALHHMSISVGASQTAGNAFTATIRAEDQYNNAVTTFNSPVYLTCPNLDYSVPTQSVIQVTGALSYYGSASTTACWRIPGSMFQSGTPGICTTTMRIYRSNPTGPTAFLYASDVDTDSPSSHTGHVGQSTNLTINTNGYARLFTIVPGITYRAGADAGGNTYFAGVGYIGNALSQQVDLPFSVTVYATDLYWNPRPTETSQFTASSSNNGTTTFNGTSAPTQFTLSGGVRQLNVSFSANSNYTLTFAVGVGVQPYTTPYTIVAFSIHHFEMKLPNGSDIPVNWQAGVPVNVSITAFDTPTTVATTFNGNANLIYSIDHTTTLQCIRPTNITFTNGWWWGPVTLFRSDQYNGQANTITVAFGTIGNPSNTVHTYPNIADRLLIIAPGMTAYPGLNPDVAFPGYSSTGASGQPNIQTAGTAITQISFFLCDAYWNTVTDTAQGATGPIRVICNDPEPATLAGLPFVGGLRTVNLGAQGFPGEYRAVNNFVLFTVAGTAGQAIRLEKVTGETPYELGVNKNKVPVRHAEPCEGFTITLGTDALGRDILTNGAIAGVPIAATITAVDAYGNTMDSINGGTPLGTYTAVNLSAFTDPPSGGYSLWPLTTGNMEFTKWELDPANGKFGGVSKPWIYVYKKAAGSGQYLTATRNFGAGDRSGNSVNFTVLPNAYARVVSIVPGMTTPDSVGAGGVYTTVYPSSPPPATAAVFNNFGTPAAQVAGIPFNIDGYSCDIYGNMIQYTNDDISMSTTDHFAPNAPDQSINAINGFGRFSIFKFHTRGTATVTVVDSDVATITAGTTPSITVNPGAFYGLQLLAPGQVAIEGSGNTNVTNMFPVPANGWYSGVTPADPTVPLSNPYTARAQLAGVFFSVTAQAADLYGNIVGSTAPTDTIELTTDGNDGLTIPTSSLPITAPMSNGRAVFGVRFGNGDAGGIRSINPRDVTNGTIKGNPDSLTKVRIAQADETRFEVVVNGVRFSDSAPVYVEAWPNTFTVWVEVRYTGTGEIVGVSQLFVLEPTLDISSPATPANGQLGQRSGETRNGVATFDASNDPSNPQTYDRAEYIHIRARNSSGAQYPALGFSPEIRVQASTPTRIEMRADASQVNQTRYVIEANRSCLVYATAYDANNNLVAGYPITMTIVSPAVTPSSLGAPELSVADSSGTLYRTFYAGANNMLHTIQATAGTAVASLEMLVTVTAAGGVYPNPFNPLLGQGIHIDYPLDRDSNVKVAIYTLLGDLVWHKEFPAGDQEGGHASVNSIVWDGKNDMGVTVANGGYICLIKANDQEKFRFKIGVYKEK